MTYIDALQPLSPGIYDAYFVYSRGGDGADLSQAPQATITTPDPTFIRTDLHVPVFLFETEADVLGLGYLPARQPPTRYIREWEVAGSAHDDTYGLLYARSDNGNGVADTDAFQSMLDPPADPIPGIVDCEAPINAGSHTYELRAAMVVVNKWMTSGQAPSQSPRLEVRQDRPAPVRHRRQWQRPRWDPHTRGPGAGGQALRARPAGHSSRSRANPGRRRRTRRSPVRRSAPSSARRCRSVAAKLAALYPSHASFVQKWDAATAAEVKAGYLLPADARTLDKVAAQSNVGG